MSQQSDHERIGPMIASHERAFSLRAAEAEEAAEQARTRKHRELGKHSGAPAEAMRAMEARHDREIAGHERDARVYRRRAAHAAAGYVLASPDDDADYLREHQGLHDLARKTGRLRSVSDSVA